jgi:hypothetical protein
MIAANVNTAFVNRTGNSITQALKNRRWGHMVAHLVEELRYKPEGRGFDSQWCHWNFSLT